MFNKEVYTTRRNELRKKLKDGVVLLLGNEESPYNYLDNLYHFRQDSTFLYFFGLAMPSLIGVIDIDNGKDWIFGNDVDIDDIIWMGPQPSMVELGARVGVENIDQLCMAQNFLINAISKGRKVHILPPYRGDHYLAYEKLLGIRPSVIKNYVSIELIEAIVSLREIKEVIEIEEIEKAIDITYEMQLTAMQLAHPGVKELEIAGAIEGISLSLGNPPSFTIILSMNGETLHNHKHHQILEEGRLMVTDCGAESLMHYAGDITRTVPVGGKFSPLQKDIYNTVLAANMKVIENTKPCITYQEQHFLATRTLIEGLKNAGLMKGDVDAALEVGAQTLFMPHGLGHAMGLDVHDMENFGENYVGYNRETQRSSVSGHRSLRFGKGLKPGMVITDEPGCYFIPALIDKWRAERMHLDFINYDAVEKMKGFGGIRIEDDILITENGCRVLGKSVPKSVEEIETVMAASREKVLAAVKSGERIKIKVLG
ncbi:MAG: aminopeptidase P family protein [Bacteroidales bacterium]|jgi:Xaa-Pro aminopeptidase|nr:aminopeptidase P family protein [Bacteroidales bacterium]